MDFSNSFGEGDPLETYYLELLARRRGIVMPQQGMSCNRVNVAAHLAKAPPQPAESLSQGTKAPAIPTAAGLGHASTPTAHRPTKGTLHKILPNVWLTDSIEVAFRALDPYLPERTVMTSGYRSDADQARIINDYFAKHHGPEELVDAESRRQWLIHHEHMVIARVGSSPHRTGLAFDLSGSPINDIEAAVQRCAKDHGKDLFPLKNTIIERKQNCLHVNLTK